MYHSKYWFWYLKKALFLIVWAVCIAGIAHAADEGNASNHLLTFCASLLYLASLVIFFFKLSHIFCILFLVRPKNKKNQEVFPSAARLLFSFLMRTFLLLGPGLGNVRAWKARPKWTLSYNMNEATCVSEPEVRVCCCLRTQKVCPSFHPFASPHQ